LKAKFISGFASVALIAVFAGTSLLTLWADSTRRHNREVTENAQQMSALYAQASADADRAELYIGLWNSTSNPDYLAEKALAQADFVSSLQEMARSPEPEDREFGEWAVVHFGAMSAVFDRLQEQPAPVFADVMLQYFDAYGALYESILAGDIGDPAIAYQLIDPRGVTDPNLLTVNPVTTIMSLKAEERDAVADAAIGATQRSEDFFGWAAPTLYGVGTLLAIVLLSVTILFGRREARTTAENAQLRRLSTTDALTQLGNRRGFEEATKRLTKVPAGTEISLVMMDLDEFKVVNDTFGHAHGDVVLVSFARLLSEIAPPGASRFRVGGDEFALLLHGHDGAAAMEVAQRLRRSAEAELGFGVTLTSGVATLSASDRDESLLVQKADAALYKGKMLGRNVTVLYDETGNATPVFAAAKSHAVRLLLDEGRIEPVFQPIWDMQANRLLGYEGLSRPDPAYGLSGPQEAFDIAEQFGHAADLDRLCRNHLLAAVNELPENVRVFLNLSPYSLTHQSFSAEALGLEVEAAGVEKSRVVFEITEKSHVATDAIAVAVRAIRAEGMAVALDDVGSGNNGLEMLRCVQFDYVKVDRAVIVAATEDGLGRAALMAILAFASESGAIVVAEGVEDAAMFSTVRTIAAQTALKGKPGLIHGVQGYMFGMPLPAAQSARELPPLLVA